MKLKQEEIAKFGEEIFNKTHLIFPQTSKKEGKMASDADKTGQAGSCHTDAAKLARLVSLVVHTYEPSRPVPLEHHMLMLLFLQVLRYLMTTKKMSWWIMKCL